MKHIRVSTYAKKNQKQRSNALSFYLSAYLFSLFEETFVQLGRPLVRQEVYCNLHNDVLLLKFRKESVAYLNYLCFYGPEYACFNFWTGLFHGNHFGRYALSKKELTKLRNKEKEVLQGL